MVAAAGAVLAGLLVPAGHARRAVTCLGKPATIVGTAHADTLRGTPHPDVIAGLGGDDTIVGLGGDDRLCGGAGDDAIDGGPGNDRADGGPGTNTCAAVEHRRACPLASGGATTATTTTISGTTYAFGSEVPQATQAEVEHAIESAKSYVQDEMGLSTSAFDVFGYGDVDEFLASYSRQFGRPVASLGNLRQTLTQIQAVHGGYAETNVGVIFLWTATTPADRPLGLTMAHEYFHVIQLQLSPQSPAQPPNQVRTNGPEWLAEGSAEYVGQQVAGRYADTLAAAVGRIGSERPDLSRLETPIGFRSLRDPFPVCMAAVGLLVRDAGPASLVAFWRATGQGTPWAQAFQQAFGRSPAAFYSEFDRTYESG